MDQKTRDQRRRNKAQATKRGQLSEFPARGLGRKLKPSEHFPLKQCDHVEGGQTSYFKKKRKDGTTYSVAFIKGGTRCANTSLTNRNGKNLCLGHLDSGS